MKYLLVWKINDYVENGGGTYFEKFDTEELLHKHVNILAAKHKEQFEILISGFLHVEYIYKPVNIITEYQPEIKRENHNNLS